jgi:DNA-binding NtrC family response regulator
MNLFNKLKEMKIVLIDDDEWIRDSLSLFFEGEGCNLRALETAEEAIETLQEQQYDIIIADYRLPGMDGLEFLRRMKETHPRAMKNLITAYKDDKVVSEARRLGVHDFIEKPFTTRTIEESLSRLIEERKQDTINPCEAFRIEQEKGLAHKLNA